MHQLKQCKICEKYIYSVRRINVCNVCNACIINKQDIAKEYVKKYIESKLHNGSYYYENNKIISNFALDLGYKVKSFHIDEEEQLYKISRSKNA